jgi:transcription antitermination protein NusB
MPAKSPTPRRLARRLALQAIYQWQLTDNSLSEIENQFLQDASEKTDIPYFLELLRGIIKTSADIDAQIKPVLDRQIDAVNPIELAILRLALYELTNRLDIPYRVVIDEALRLAKTFGAVEGYKYVNGVLDKIAHQLRAVEIASKNKP